MNAGEYLGFITKTGIKAAKSGTLQVLVELTADEGGSITFYGGLKPGQNTEITLETLRELGLKGNDLAPLADDDGLDRNMQVKFKVVDDTYNGKTTQKVQWVGDPKANKGPFQDILSRGDAVKQLAGLKLQGVLAKMPEKEVEFDPEESLPF